MFSFFIVFSVVVSGAAILILEILGTRVLGPHYGVSLYLWSALIGVTLAALSAGYALGGRWADRGPVLSRFGLLYLLAGFSTLAIPLGVRPILNLLEPWDLRAASLTGATVLFFPPLLLLGMAAPYALRLLATRLETVGRTAGNLYAVSTLASVAAAIGTGFYLIPHFGVRRLLLMTGLLLVGTGVCGLVLGRRSRRAAPILALPLVLAAAGTLAPGERAIPERGLLAVAQSPYGEIRVLDHEGLRYMLIDGAPHSIADPLTWRSSYPYADVLEIGKRLRPEPGRMLLIGLGAGSVAKSYAKAGWSVEAVEIDPVVTRLAREHFGFTDADAEVHHRDGRRFLREQPEGSFDLIVVDAFGSSAVPFHLVTEEVFALIRSRLREGGLLAMNVEAVGWRDVLVGSIAATMATAFAEVAVLPIAEPPTVLGNLILLASDRALELGDELDLPASRWSGQYNLVHAWENRFGPPPGQPILTDDHNSVGLWSNRINRVARRDLHEFFEGVDLVY